MSNSKRVTVVLSSEECDALQALADGECRPVSQCVRMLIRSAIKAAVLPIPKDVAAWIGQHEERPGYAVKVLRAGIAHHEGKAQRSNGS